jgi:hypothetical protein
MQLSLYVVLKDFWIRGSREVLTWKKWWTPWWNVVELAVTSRDKMNGHP